MRKNRSFGVLLTEGILHLHGLLPLGYHRAMARPIAFLMGKVFHYRTDVVMTNLARCFPDQSYDGLKQIRDRFYRHLACIFTEMVWFGACRGEKGRKRLRRSHIVEISNAGELNRLLAAAPQLMILQAHTGNWELIGGILEYAYDTPLDIQPDAIAVTYVNQHSALWNAVMADNRTAPVADTGFDGYVETAQILRYVLERRDRKFTYSFITDQKPYRPVGKNAEVSFMGQRTQTMTGGAALACRLDMAVVYLRFECREDGGYRMTFVPMAEHAASSTPEEIIKAYYGLLEEDIRKQPWNYLWTHKRWKK